jgi:hypothetical protein
MALCRSLSSFVFLFTVLSSLQAFPPQEAFAQAVPAAPQSIIFLCNETAFQVVAQYTLTVSGKPLPLSQNLDPISGRFGDTSTCFPIRIPNYEGPVTVTGSMLGQRFPAKNLNATYGQALYVWYYNEGTQCWSTSTPYKVCLEL